MIRNPRNAGPVICGSWVDCLEKWDAGVGFSQFISGPASRFIGGLQLPKPGKSRRSTPKPSAAGLKSWSTHRARKSPPMKRESSNELRARIPENQAISSPPMKRKRQGLSFAVHAWTPPKNPIQASDFRGIMSGPASRFIVGLAPRPWFQPAGRRARRRSSATKRARAAARAARRRPATPGILSAFRALVCPYSTGDRRADAADSRRLNAASWGNLAKAQRAGSKTRRRPTLRTEEARRPGQKPRPRRSGSRCAARSGNRPSGTGAPIAPWASAGHRHPRSSSHSAKTGRAAPGSSSGAHSVDRASSSRLRRSGAPRTITPIRS